MSNSLFTAAGGYRKLHSFTFATMIHLGTNRFCKRFIPYQDDPLGKTAGQMVGAARSGRQNIIEGSERAATSKETEIKLTDVARASLAELLGDYEIFLADTGEIPWARDRRERQMVGNLQLKTFERTEDTMHDYWVYFHKEKQSFAPWLENEDSVIVANSMLVLILRTMAMLDAQIECLGKEFLKDGGFRERMYQSRTRERDKTTPSEPDAPSCPECGKTMRKRMPRNGSNAGKPFWGCPGFPDCRGTRKWDAGT